MTTISYGQASIVALLGQHYEEDTPDVIEQVNGWLVRGDGIAVYQNQDMGHPDVGHIMLASFGSDLALLETDTPPTTLPDTPQGINWRYQLIGTYRGELIQ